MKVRFEPVYLQGDFYRTCLVTKVNHSAGVPGREHLGMDRSGLHILEQEAESQQNCAPQGYLHEQ